MNRYHTRSKFNPNCPQKDSREVGPNPIQYIAQRPSRRIPHAVEGTPQSLRFGPVTPEFLAMLDEVEA